jgi:hypothetical protein
MLTIFSMAVCLMPGTELAFDRKVTSLTGLLGWPKAIDHQTAIFRQINKEKGGGTSCRARISRWARGVADADVLRPSGERAATANAAKDRSRSARARAGGICWVKL